MNNGRVDMLSEDKQSIEPTIDPGERVVIISTQPDQTFRDKSNGGPDIFKVQDFS